MKNTSFKRLWTKTSVKRILAEYKESDVEFLCYASAEFADLWADSGHQKKIKTLAKKFGKGVVYECGEGLFYTDYSNSREIRIVFLEHEIMRLSAK